MAEWLFPLIHSLYLTQTFLHVCYFGFLECDTKSALLSKGLVRKKSTDRKSENLPTFKICQISSLPQMQQLADLQLADPILFCHQRNCNLRTQFLLQTSANPQKHKKIKNKGHYAFMVISTEFCLLNRLLLRQFRDMVSCDCFKKKILALVFLFLADVARCGSNWYHKNLLIFSSGMAQLAICVIIIKHIRFVIPRTCTFANKQMNQKERQRGNSRVRREYSFEENISELFALEVKKLILFALFASKRICKLCNGKLEKEGNIRIKANIFS